MREQPYEDENGAWHEWLTYSDYSFYTEQRSRIDRGRTIRVKGGFHCPHCHRTNPPLNHGKPFVCQCGLQMTLWGNALECVLPKGK
ncbi:MAG: hypothetical protein WC977_15035 [Anaerovoracaceae bacterium]|jgi:hypothetical protein